MRWSLSNSSPAKVSHIHPSHSYNITQTNTPLPLTAADNNKASHRKTIEGGDILEALERTGFENYAEALRPYLEGYRAERQRAKEANAENSEGAAGGGGQEEEEEE